jgi:serine/threonine-protein kinase
LPAVEGTTPHGPAPAGPTDAGGPLEQLEKYQPIAEIARGSLGTVYLAVARGPKLLGRLLAVKELRPDLAQVDSAVTKFLDEARIVARLKHPNLVETLAVGSHGTRHFHAMEYVDGQPLRAVMQRAHVQGVPMSLAMHLRVTLDVLAALEYVRSVADVEGKAVSVPHLGTHNVIVTHDGSVKLLGLSIASASETTSDDEEGGSRANVFAAGAMLWEGVVMSRSVVGAKRGSPHANGARRDIDPELFAIVERAMNGKAAQRYPTVGDMRDALKAHVETSHVVLPGPSGLAALVSQLFAEERVQRQEILHTQLRRLNHPTGDMQSQAPLPRLAPTPSPPLPRLEHTPVVPGVSPRARTLPLPAPAVHVPAAPAVPSFPPTEASVPASAPPAPVVVPTRKRARLVAFAAGGATLSALATFAISLALSGPSGGPSAALPSQAPAAQSERAAKVSTSHTIIRATPPSVRIYVDDAIVSNPFVADFPLDPAQHRIRAEAPGYAAQEETVTFDRDTVLHFALAALPAPGVQPSQGVAPARVPVAPAVMPVSPAPAVRPMHPPPARPSAPPPVTASALAVASPAAAPSVPALGAQAPLSAIDTPAPKPEREIFKRNPYLQ